MKPSFFTPLDGHLSLLAATGPDALPFLHNQLTNAVEDLRPGMARRAGYCSPKGRLLADFVMWRDDLDGVPRVFLALDQSIAAGVAKRLSMFILRSKVKLVDATAQWAMFGVTGSVARAASSLMTLTPPGGLGYVLAPRDQAAAARTLLSETLPEEALPAWLLTEVMAGIPRIVATTQDLFVPQMVNFELLGGVDFGKGCFPGQEVVARSQNLSQLKRRMQLVSSTMHPAAGTVVVNASGDAVGHVVNACDTAVLLECDQLYVSSEASSLHIGSTDTPALSFLPLPYAIPVHTPFVRPKL